MAPWCHGWPILLYFCLAFLRLCFLPCGHRIAPAHSYPSLPTSKPVLWAGKSEDTGQLSQPFLWKLSWSLAQWFLLFPHWPELCTMTILSCPGGWAIQVFSWAYCSVSKPLVRKNRYWNRQLICTSGPAFKVLSVLVFLNAPKLVKGKGEQIITLEIWEIVLCRIISFLVINRVNKMFLNSKDLAVLRCFVN